MGIKPRLATALALVAICQLPNYVYAEQQATAAVPEVTANTSSPAPAYASSTTSSSAALPAPTSSTASESSAVTPLTKLDIELSNYAYPFPVTYFPVTVQNQKLKMAYMDVQPAGNPRAPAVVLMHGKNFNGAYWESTAHALVEAGYRVIIPDQIGFGKSSKPEHLQYSFQMLAHNTYQLLKQMNLNRVTVLGHSMGGMLATRFALSYPEFTERLVLLNPIGLEDYQHFFPYQPVNEWYRAALTQNRESIKRYQLNSYYDGKWRPEYQQWVDLLAGWTLAEDYPVVAWNSALTFDMIYTQPVVYEFDQVKSPTLLIIGTRDRTALGKNLVSDQVRATMGQYQQLGKATQKKIPGAQLVELEAIGHLPHIEAFAQFIEPLLQFLASSAPKDL